MCSEGDIDGAVTAGAISRDAAAALRAHVARTQAAPAVDEERFRLVTGFNDIFVSIAIALLLVALAQIGAQAAMPLGAALVAAASWMLAEFFTARRRMALPSIILLLALAGGVAATLGLAAAQAGPDLSSRAGALVGSGVAAVTAFAAWLHWRRFAVPITVASIAGVSVTRASGRQSRCAASAWRVAASVSPVTGRPLAC